MKKNRFILKAQVSIILAILFILSGCMAGPWAGRGMPYGMMRPVQSEFEFLVEMIPHHQEAVDTANATVLRTARPELRDFAQKIVQVQSEEINMMKAWLAEYYPGRATDSYYRPMMRPTAGLSAERADQAFLEDMVMHHRMAVMMANQVLAGNVTSRPEVRKLAAGIIQSQNREIEQMEKWLSNWYDVRTGGRMGY